MAAIQGDLWKRLRWLLESQPSYLYRQAESLKEAAGTEHCVAKSSGAGGGDCRLAPQLVAQLTAWQFKHGKLALRLLYEEGGPY